MPRRIWEKTEHPNRPVDCTVAAELNCGDRLHKGACRETDYMYFGDHKHTRYIVGGMMFQVNFPNDPKQAAVWMTPELVRAAKFDLNIIDVDLLLVNELSMESFHVRLPDTLQYHRLSDCASRKRKPGNQKAPAKPGAHQNISIGKNAKPNKPVQ